MCCVKRKQKVSLGHKLAPASGGLGKATEIKAFCFIDLLLVNDFTGVEFDSMTMQSPKHGALPLTFPFSISILFSGTLSVMYVYVPPSFSNLLLPTVTAADRIYMCTL